MTLFNKMVSSVGLTLLLLTLLGCSHDNKKCEDDVECMLSKVTASYKVEFLGNDKTTLKADNASQSQRTNALGALIVDKSGGGFTVGNNCELKLEKKRKRGGEGKRVDIGGGRIIKKKKKKR